jgi:hypothetical protein
VRDRGFRGPAGSDRGRRYDIPHRRRENQRTVRELMRFSGGFAAKSAFAEY